MEYNVHWVLQSHAKVIKKKTVAVSCTLLCCLEVMFLTKVCQKEELRGLPSAGRARHNLNTNPTWVKLPWLSSRSSVSDRQTVAWQLWGYGLTISPTSSSENSLVYGVGLIGMTVSVDTHPAYVVEDSSPGCWGRSPPLWDGNSVRESCRL